MTDPRDPGWRPAIGAALVPVKGARLVRDGGSALLVMRALWIAFTTAIVLIGVVVILVSTELPGGGIDGRFTTAVVVALGVLAQAVAGAVLPAIAGMKAGDVRRTAQRAFFIRVLLAEPAALFGFLGFALSGNPAVYLAGAVVSFAGMVDAMPGERWLASGQAQLVESGSSVDLLDALLRGGVTR